MNGFIDWTTFFFSVVAAAVASWVALILDAQKHKRDVVTQAITSNRMEWIAQVRNLIGEFLCAYINKEPKENLLKLMFKIELYLRQNGSADYEHLITCMERCYNQPYMNSDGNSRAACDELVHAAQTVLHNTWIRIKIEGGQSAKKDDSIRKQIEKYQ